MTHVVVDLDEHGDVLDPESGRPLPREAVNGFLARHLHVPPDVSDIVVYVHGWRNTREKVLADCPRFFASLERLHRDELGRYQALPTWSGHYVLVRWPSMSNPFLSGYRRIRDRAHAMTTTGRAAAVLAQLLGYLNARRKLPGSPTTLRTSGGQYLHCVGHSFGGRFLVEAVQAAADRKPTALGWNRNNPRYPYTVDTLLVFQMAAPIDVFAHKFARILHDAPVNGPIVLTHARTDRATGLWHHLAEGKQGVGHTGARHPVDHISHIKLLGLKNDYQRADFEARIVNVDSAWRFRRGRFWNPAGAHSDIWYPESAHLLLSLAHLAR